MKEEKMRNVILVLPISERPFLNAIEAMYYPNVFFLEDEEMYSIRCKRVDRVGIAVWASITETGLRKLIEDYDLVKADTSVEMYHFKFDEES